jgi:hypothetical protein
MVLFVCSVVSEALPPHNSTRRGCNGLLISPEGKMVIVCICVRVCMYVYACVCNGPLISPASARKYYQSCGEVFSINVVRVSRNKHKHKRMHTQRHTNHTTPNSKQEVTPEQFMPLSERGACHKV